MQYDPIKQYLGKIFNISTGFRILFYKLLDLILLRTWHIKKEIRLLKKSFPQNANILDGGSGFGQYVYYLSTLSNSWNIKGLDIKTEQVEDCNQFFKKLGLSNRINFEVADLTKFVDPANFDMILSVDVMEHILEDVTVFKNFNNSLKQGGVLLLSTPSDKGGSDVHVDHQSSFIEEHLRDGYNMIEIEEKLFATGFTKVEARYAYGTPGTISWRFSMKYPIMLLNVHKIFILIIPFYFILVLPFAMLLNYMDIRIKHRRGTGLIVKAWK